MIHKRKNPNAFGVWDLNTGFIWFQSSCFTGFDSILEFI